MKLQTFKDAGLVGLLVSLAGWFLTESTINVIALGHYFGWW